MVVPVAVPPLIKVQSFMRISLMIGIGGGDGGSPVDHYVDELPSHVTTGFGPRMEFSAAESGSRFVDYAGSLLRFADRTVAHRCVLRWSSDSAPGCGSRRLGSTGKPP